MDLNFYEIEIQNITKLTFLHTKVQDTNEHLQHI